MRRRQMLRALGLGAGAMFLPSLGGRTVRAAEGDAPRRVIILTSEHQIVGDAWQMLRGNPDAAQFEYPLDDPDPASFSEILRPLHPYRDKLTVLDGLAYLSGERNSAGVGNGHNISHLTALTGAEPLSNTSAGGASIDQIIAQAVAVPGRIPSLELATRSPWLGGFVNLGPSARAPVERSPKNLFGRLFPPEAESPSEPTTDELIRRERANVLDFVASEYQQMARRLSSADKQKLEHHRGLIADLQARIEGLGTLTCERPEGTGESWAGPSAHPLEVFSQFAMLTAAAFACDVTRVATIQITGIPNAAFGAPPGDLHQDIAHAAKSEPAKSRMVAFNRLHAEMMSELVSLLDSYPEGNGTLLDNTAVLWIPEHGHRKLLTNQQVFGEAHHGLEIPVVMAGSCGGAFRTGRYISYEREPVQLSYNQGLTGPAHNKLFVSLARAMGLDVDWVNATQRTIGGKTFDLTGPLPRLA